MCLGSKEGEKQKVEWHSPAKKSILCRAVLVMPVVLTEGRMQQRQSRALARPSPARFSAGLSRTNTTELILYCCSHVLSSYLRWTVTDFLGPRLQRTESPFLSKWFRSHAVGLFHQESASYLFQQFSPGIGLKILPFKQNSLLVMTSMFSAWLR